MKGKILSYTPDLGTGIISGEDGKRYNFEINDWKASARPVAGRNVDFTAQDNKATDVYQITSELNNFFTKRIIAILLAFFFGAIGAHKFYLGYTKQGLIMLLVFVVGLILFGIPSFIVAIIALIEMIKYLITSEDDFEVIYISGRKPWF